MLPFNGFNVFSSAIVYGKNDHLATSSQRSIIDIYWDLAREVAERKYLCFSDLVDCSIEYRTCCICGSVSNSNSYGQVKKCSEEKCIAVREFFLICGDNSSWYINPGCGSNGRKNLKLRAQFLQRTMNSELGSTRLWDAIREHGNEIVFLFLVKCMAWRIAHEHG